MKHARFTLALLALLFFSQVPAAIAQEKFSDHFKIYGFTADPFNLYGGINGHGEFWYPWSIGERKTYLDEFKLFFITPERSSKVGRSSWLIWKKPVPGVDAVRFGRGIPNSSIVKSLVAGADGAEIETHAGKVQVVAGAFIKNRSGRNIFEHNSPWNFYLHLKRPITDNLLASVSSNKDDFNGNLVWQLEQFLLTAKYIDSEYPEWHFLGEKRFAGNMKATLRFEHLKGDKQWHFLGERQLSNGLKATFRFDHLKGDEQWHFLGEKRFSGNMKVTLRFERLRGDEQRVLVGSRIAFTEKLKFTVDGILSDKKSTNSIRTQITMRWQ